MGASLWPWITLGAPYAMVLVLGIAVGLAELAATFPTYPSEALRTRWAKLLLGVNACSALLAFWIAHTYAPEANVPLLVLGVGVGFQALIRSRFTLAKQIGGSGQNVEINLGWLYDQFQALCKTQIDLELMQGRQSAVTGLLARYPTLQALHGMAVYAIMARSTLTAQEREAHRVALDTLFTSNTPSELARALMALRILEHGGQAYVDLLLRQPLPSTPTPESLVAQLVTRYSVLELVQLAQRRLTPEAHAWVERVAQPTPDASEADRTVTIAQMLVRQVSADVLQQELRRTP